VTWNTTVKLLFTLRFPLAARSFLAVGMCSNCVFVLVEGYGENPCFLSCAVWESADVDGSGLVVSLLDVGGIRV
jgi:hypothetical protein